MDFSIAQINDVLSLIKHLEEIAPILFSAMQAPFANLPIPIPPLPSPTPQINNPITAAGIHLVIILKLLFRKPPVK